MVDNLERAIKDTEETGTDDASLKGIRLTHKVLLSILEKNGVVAVGNVGDTFNPEIHEAVGIFPEAEKRHHRSGTSKKATFSTNAP